jgi:hypothetical protein
VSEMWQNPANFAMCLSIIWRIKSNSIKYSVIRLERSRRCVRRVE